MIKYLRIFIIALTVFIFGNSIHAQVPFPKINADDPAIPQWAKMMYSDVPNVIAVDNAYNAFYLSHPFIENNYTRYYVRWRRFVNEYVQEDGSLKFPTAQEEIVHKNSIDKLIQSPVAKQTGAWNFAGPDKHFTTKYSVADSNVQISEQANVYCVDQSMSNTNVLYAGGESGGVYKSTDKGLNWEFVTRDLAVNTVNAVQINPADENFVLFNSEGKIFKTIDGGLTWNMTGDSLFQTQNKNVWQFVFNPVNPMIVYAGTDQSLLRSVDGGDTWSVIFTNQCMSVAVKPNDPSVIYALQYDPVTQISYFYKSLDSGITFTQKPLGWFSVPPIDAGKIHNLGGRIAVTEANNDKVYVLLVGESDASAQLQLRGTIGVYVSADAGESWSFPHAQMGMPYNVATHPNLMDFDGHTSNYDQIYYNTAFIASQLDENKTLIGGLNMWRSDDGGTTYSAVGGYIGNSLPYMHVDLQEMKVYKTSPTSEEVWFSSDGGINYSPDWCTTHESRCNGIFAGEFWGFDQGWNDDVMCGGRYHNGNCGYYETYPQGEFLSLGGGEAPTGYVNYSDERKTYFSDIGGKILPDSINYLVQSFGISPTPNESYYESASSRIMFDWRYWNVAYMGRDNVLYKSINGGAGYGQLFSFGTIAGNKIYWMEQSRVNPDVMYVQQVINNLSRIWKTTDGGVAWNQITLPQYKREIYFSISLANADELWIAFAQGANGSKIYHTTNSGSSWTNITTNKFDGLQIKAIAHQGGTDGGVYAATYHGPVFYRNNTMPDWDVVGTNLPAVSYPLRLVPFYKENKLRLAMWNLAIWENDLYEPSNLVADFSANYESYFCPGDTVSFIDHSVASANAAYQWTFTGAIPSTSTLKNPKVVYTTNGTNDVQLIVTDNGISDTVIKPNFIHTVNTAFLPLVEDFESGNFSTSWKLQGDGLTPSAWSIDDTVGSFGTSTKCMRYDNYDYDAQGKHDAMWTSKLDFTNVSGALLTFDVAYSRYGGQYSDTLEVLVSTDCGATFTSMYIKGGDTLATAPSIQNVIFVPAVNEWRTDTINLGQFAGNPEVIVAFTNIGYWGQALYVDNINIHAPTALQNISDDETALTVFPNPATDKIVVNYSSKKSQQVKLKIENSLGKLIFEKEIKSNSTIFSETIDTRKFAKGIYWVSVDDGSNNSVKKIVMQ